MTVEQFETLALNICVGGLVLYMLFIMYRLARDSNAGRFGTLVIFLSLGLGIAGFAAKSLIQMLLEV